MDGITIHAAGIAADFAAVLAAFLLALPIAWERGHGARSSGFRTLPIVAMAACGVALILNLGPEDSEARARVLQGVITGIGFIGGGAILKNGDHVKGLATAASIWNAGAIGVACGLGNYPVAAMLSLINFISLLVLARIDDSPPERGES